MGAATGLLSLFTTAVGSVNADEAERSSAAAQQKELQDNQSLANRAAIDAQMRGATESGRARMQGSQLIDQQNVAYANSGVDPTQGTPMSVMADTRLMSELDAQTLTNNAAREAWGFKKYGMKYQQQAGLDAARSANRRESIALTGMGRFANTLGATDWGLGSGDSRSASQRRGDRAFEDG